MNKKNPARQKKNLNEEIKERVRQMDLSIEKMAQRVNLNPSSVRTFIKRNIYPKEELGLITSFLGLPIEITELEESYTFILARDKYVTKRELARQKQAGEHNLSTALRIMDERLDQGGKNLYKDFGEDVRILVNSMNENDVFVYHSLTEKPYELQVVGWRETKESIVGAIERGAYFLYLFPDATAQERMLKLGIEIPSQESFQRDFEKFAEQMKGFLESRDFHNQVAAIYYDESPFNAAGHKYVCFSCNDPQREVSVRALARFPAGTKARQHLLLLPLDEVVTNQFVSFVTAMIKQELGKNKKEKNSISVLNRILNLLQ